MAPLKEVPTVALHGRDQRAFPSQGVILDLARRPVDATSWKWRLNDATGRSLLNWSNVDFHSYEIFEATVRFGAELVRYRSPASVLGWFLMLRRMTSVKQFRKEDADGQVISFATFSALMEELGKSQRYRVRLLRDWYAWCCDQGMKRFDPDVAFRLSETVFGGSEKGRAVLSLDPEEGPLVDTEIVALLNRLRAVEGTGLLTLQETVAVWLCLSLGANAAQYVLLQDEDFERLSGDGETSIFQLQVPRMKNNLGRERAQFRTRKLIDEIGVLLERLIAENARLCKEKFRRYAVAVPIFLRKSLPRTRLSDSMSEYALAMTATEFTRMVSAAVERLGVTSPRTGRLLRVTARRFRYTFATRLVREGASQRAVADALDHSDLQHVQVYFDLKSDIVEKLDAAMAMALGPLSQAFLGHLVHREADAVRGDVTASRIYHHKQGPQEFQAVGTCGSFSFCGLTAPLACYTCRKFQPWIEAPHQVVLADLLAERERRAARGLDERMVAVHDATILAVADVVSRVAAAREAA